MPLDPYRRLYTPDQQAQQGPALPWLTPPPMPEDDPQMGQNIEKMGNAFQQRFGKGPKAPKAEMPTDMPVIPEPEIPIPNFDFGAPRDVKPLSAMGGKMGDMGGKMSGGMKSL